MVLEKLGSSLRSTIGKIKNSLVVDRELVGEVVKEIQRSLLKSDVNVHLVLSLTEKIRKRAIEEDNKNLSKKEHLITIIYEELSEILGGDKEFVLKEVQNRIMLVGLYGQGKTTTAAKLGNYFKSRSKKVALISIDTHRQAAYEQLKQLGSSVGIDVFGNPNEKNPQKIYNSYKEELESYDVVIIDSAGRDSLNEELIEEIELIKNFVEPTDVFFVLGADVGQTAQKQAEAFKESVDVTGVVITKLDGTGKAGGALSACYKAECPVYFVGVGEGVEDFEKFNAKRFVSQLLGMGDIEGLLEKANLVVDEQSSQRLQKRLESGEFDLNDLCQQMRTLKKMGSISKITSFIPGFQNLGVSKEEMRNQQQKIEKWEIMMQSMTDFEKKKPLNLTVSHFKRISKGSGSSVGDVREMIKQYKQMKKMTTLFKNSQGLEEMDEKSLRNPQQMAQMMKKMGGGKTLRKMMRRK